MKKSIFKNTWELLRESFQGFSSDKIPQKSAALAYYTIFSIGPMLIIIISLCGFLYGRDAIEGRIYGQIKALVGSGAAMEIQDIIRNATLSDNFSFATIVGVIALIFGATSVFTEIQDSINYIWHLRAKPRKGWLKMLLNRLLSFSMVVSLGFILLVSLVLSALMELLVFQLRQLFPGVAVSLAYILNILITFGLTALLFAIIFKVLPDAFIRWKDVAVGALVTALLFLLGKFAIGYYLGSSHVGSTYGAAGSLVIVLLWVYYSAIILYFGAEFTKVYAQRFGGDIRPNHYAVWLKTVEVESVSGTLHDHAAKEKKEEN